MDVRLSFLEILYFSVLSKHSSGAVALLVLTAEGQQEQRCTPPSSQVVLSLSLHVFLTLGVTEHGDCWSSLDLSLLLMEDSRKLKTHVHDDHVSGFLRIWICVSWTAPREKVAVMVLTDHRM